MLAQDGGALPLPLAAFAGWPRHPSNLRHSVRTPGPTDARSLLPQHLQRMSVMAPMELLNAAAKRGAEDPPSTPPDAKKAAVMGAQMHQEAYGVLAASTSSASYSSAEAYSARSSASRASPRLSTTEAAPPRTRQFGAPPHSLERS